LRGEDDGSAFSTSAREKAHDLALQDGVHASGKFVEEKNRCFDHENFSDLDATAETAAEVLDFAVGFGGELKFFNKTAGTLVGCRFVETLETGVSEEIVF